MGDIGRVGTPDSEAPNRPMQCYRETAPFLDRKKNILVISWSHLAGVSEECQRCRAPC